MYILNNNGDKLQPCLNRNINSKWQFRSCATIAFSQRHVSSLILKNVCFCKICAALYTALRNQTVDFVVLRKALVTLTHT